MRTNGAVFKQKRQADHMVRVEFTTDERKRIDSEAMKRTQTQGQAPFHYHRTGVIGEAAAMRSLGLPLAFCHESDCGTDFLFV